MSIIPVVYATPIPLSQNYGFGNIQSVPDLVGKLMGPAFSIAALAVTFYFIFGAFKLLTSGGDKNAVAEARNMITHAIIGIVLLLMMWLVLRFIPEFLGLNIKIF